MSPPSSKLRITTLVCQPGTTPSPIPAGGICIVPRNLSQSSRPPQCIARDHQQDYIPRRSALLVAKPLGAPRLHGRLWW
eukprot:574190-Amphidinium_carterae.2